MTSPPNSLTATESVSQPSIPGGVSPSWLVTAGKVVIWVVAIALLLASAVLALASKSTYIVTTGSMTPAIEPGDALFVRSTRPSSLQVGDVITFRVPDHSEIVTHRIYAIDDDGFQTKGDFNSDPDPWHVAADQVIGEVRLVIPNVGLYLSHIRSSGTGFLLVTVPLVLLLIFQSRVVVTEWKKWRATNEARG